MSLPHTLLGLLQYKPMTGYELKQVFTHSIHHFWNAHMSQIYRELNGMEKKGWVVSQIIPQEGKPDRRVYQITPAGAEAFQTWLVDYQASFAEPLRDSLVARIFFSSRVGLDGLEKAMTQYLEQVQLRQQALAQAPQDLQRYKEKVGEEEAFYWNLTRLKGEMIVQANIAWAQQCLTLIRQRKEG